MTKNEFIREFASETGLTLKNAKAYADILGRIVVAHMKDEDGVTPFTGVKFTAVYREAHDGRNPLTGEAIKVPGKYSGKVKFGAQVKNALND